MIKYLMLIIARGLSKIFINQKKCINNLHFSVSCNVSKIFNIHGVIWLKNPSFMLKANCKYFSVISQNVYYNPEPGTTTNLSDTKLSIKVQQSRQSFGYDFSWKPPKVGLPANPLDYPFYRFSQCAQCLENPQNIKRNYKNWKSRDHDYFTENVIWRHSRNCTSFQ